MKKVTLSIRKPQWWTGDKYWGVISDTVMQLLYSRFGVIENYEVQCGWRLDSFLADDQLRRLALHTFNSTLPAIVQHVGELVIVGDGACPECGSNDRTDLTGQYTHDGECGGFNVLGWRCNNCQFETITN